MKSDAPEDATGNHRIQREATRDTARLSRYGELDAGDGGVAAIRHSAAR